MRIIVRINSVILVEFKALGTGMLMSNYGMPI